MQTFGHAGWQGEGKAFSGDLLENNVHVVKILYCTLGNWWKGELCSVGCCLFLFFCYNKKKMGGTNSVA